MEERNDDDGRGKVEDIREKVNVGSALAQLIRSTSDRFSSHECAFRVVPALSETSFDGSKPSLLKSLGNCTAAHRLREYGIQRTIMFVLAAIPDLYECEPLKKTQQVLILHDDNVLIRIRNTAEDADDKVMHVNIRSILIALERDDGQAHSQIGRQRADSEIVEWMSNALYNIRNRVIRMPANALFVGIAVGAVAYYLFH